MNKQYKKISFTVGTTIERAVQDLLDYNKNGHLVYGEFNGVALYSDTVTMDGAFKAITGKTKTEFDEIASQ